MKPVLISHSTYQDSVLERPRAHYSGGIIITFSGADTTIYFNYNIIEYFYS